MSQSSKEHKRNWYLKNKERILSETKERRLKNIDKIREKDRIRDAIRRKNPKYISDTILRKRKWRLKEENLQKGREYQKRKHQEYRNNNPVILKISKTKEELKTSRSETSNKYYLKNRKKIHEYQRVYRNKQRKENPRKRLDYNMSCNLWIVLRDKKDNMTWEKIVGYSIQELMVHLEKQFDNNMTWENYGKYWHVDHRIPKSWFKYETIDDEEFKKCWALENLQPLEAKKNYSKGNRYATM